MALVYTPGAERGALCPSFQLPATDGKTYGRPEGVPFLVMFICNHCPYVKAIEDRLVQLGQDLKRIGIETLAICSNDPVAHPEDNFENMKKRAEEKGYSFPYLQDLSQDVAKAFGAVCTPDFFLYDSTGQLYYRGRLDDSWKHPDRVQNRELWKAAQSLFAGSPPPVEQVPSMGCSMKWK